MEFQRKSVVCGNHAIFSQHFPVCDLHHTVASSRHQVDETLPSLRTGQEVAHVKMYVLVFYQKAIAENCINYSVIEFC